jgi:hypothetical protein
LDYLEALKVFHQRLAPNTYVEIGCRRGASLALSQCQIIAIDPDFEIRHALEAPTRLFRKTSDAFFSKQDLDFLLGGAFDVAFIDGMHNAEFALRDFINLESNAHSGSVILVDHVLPQDIAWTTRDSQTVAWTGDVYKLIPLLRKVRPDLEIEVFDVDMKGLAVIHGLTPRNTSLKDELDLHEMYLTSEDSVLRSVDQIRTVLDPRPACEIDNFAAGLSESRKSNSRIPANACEAYLDLLIRTLLNEIYLDDELRLLYLRDCLNESETFDFAVYHDIRQTRRGTYRSLQASREIGQFPERDIHPQDSATPWSVASDLPAYINRWTQCVCRQSKAISLSVAFGAVEVAY